MTHQVKFADKHASRLVFQIAKRAREELAINRRVWPDHQSLVMDISACHANGNPLRLQELLDAEPFDFAHDIYGIGANLDRETGKLKNGFSPRYSVPVLA